MSNTGVISMKHYDSGEENGIKWFVDLNPSKGEWTVTVTNDVETKTESFHWAYEPRFGIDILDANQIESILDKFINELSNNE